MPFARFGPPEVLRLDEAPTPVPGPEEIVVAITMPLREAAEAHRMIESGRASRGRIVLDARES